MSVELVAKIEEAKKKALEKGTIIELRKNDLTKKQKGDRGNYTWYQTPTKVGIQIPYGVTKKQDFICDIKKDKITVSFAIPSGHFHLEVNLYKQIVTSRTNKILRLHNTEIVMQKKDPSISWVTLSRDRTTFAQAQQTQQLSYPSSSKTKKNWDKIEVEIDKDIMKHPEQYSVDPSMLFFQEIFAKGDEEKRKAMMKSFQTSGGTVLSTDWSDVSKKDYEGKDRPSPPKGQQWKKRQI